MLRSNCFSLLIALSLVLPATAYAMKVSPTFLFGFGAGGSQLKKATPGTDFDIETGDGFLFGAGATFRISDTMPHAFESQLTLNFMFNSDSDENQGNVSWDRYTADLISYYYNRRDNFRLGWGITHHFKNELEGEGNRSGATMGFNKPTGFVLAAELVPPDKDMPKFGGSFGLRYTTITYKADNGVSVNGDSFFLVFNYILR